MNGDLVSMRPKIVVVVGTRPEIIKMASIIRAIQDDPTLDFILVSSGQHYDYQLHKQFFDELELPSPDVNLNIGSGTHAEQTSRMLLEYEKVFKKYCPDLVLVEGDTNTVVAAGLVAIKLHIPLGHVEAGLRSYDRTMPEEINRRIAGVCAELHFAPTETAALNLLHEGVPPHKIFITGNTIVDACQQHLEIACQKSEILEHFGLNTDQRFAIVTVHRPENVDSRPKLKQIITILRSLKDVKLIFPIHPRTRKMLEKFELIKELEDANNIVLSKPIGYLDFLKLLSKSAFVLTDSGGIQEEAVTLKIPCLTLRNNTERPETVRMGANRLVGLNNELIRKFVNEILYSDLYKKVWKKPNPYGDGKTGRRIVDLSKSACLRGLKVPSSIFLKKGSGIYKLLKVNAGEDDKKLKESSDINKSSIVLMYDQNGNPHFPDFQFLSKKGWSFLVLDE